MAGRPDIYDFEELLKYDNTTEYEHSYSLKGLPDLFLREEVRRRLVAAGEIQESSSVLELSVDDFTSAIARLYERLDRHFTIRLRPYKQNFDTCGAACVMSILDRRGVPLNVDTELKIWEMVGKPYNFPGGLAWVMLNNGFHVSYYQDRPELLSKENPEFFRMSPALVDAARTYVDLHQKAVESGLRFVIKNWNYATVVNEIKNGNVCLIYLYVTDTVSHVVIARGYRKDRLEIIDPLGGIGHLSEERLNKMIVTPMGKRMLVVEKLPTSLLSQLDARINEINRPVP